MNSSAEACLLDFTVTQLMRLLHTNISDNTYCYNLHFGGTALKVQSVMFESLFKTLEIMNNYDLLL